jgi:hypothetical protein
MNDYSVNLFFIEQFNYLNSFQEAMKMPTSYCFRKRDLDVQVPSCFIIITSFLGHLLRLI